jgi:mannose-1-phosphate guanylyltransferase/phosphomannomutase
VREVPSNPRALTEAAREDGVILASAGEGDLIFPALHRAPDALFAIGKLLELLQRAGMSVEELADGAPAMPTTRISIPCPVERKGEVMRRFAEEVGRDCATFVEGVKARLDGGWVLLRPDRVDPELHLHTEGSSSSEAVALANRFRRRVEKIVGSAK